MLEENPRGRRKRSNPKRKRKSGRRKAKKTTVTTVVRANPRRSGRRRNPTPMVRRRRSGRRRNPAGLAWSAMGAAFVGGAAARGAGMLLGKIPQLTGYYYLAADSALPLVLGIGAAYAGAPNMALGMIGAGGAKIVDNALTAYTLFSAADKVQPKPAGAQGLGSIRQLYADSRVNAGVGSMRAVRAR